MIGIRIGDGRGNGAGQGWNGGFDLFVVCQFYWRFNTHKRIVKITYYRSGFKRGLKWTFSLAEAGYYVAGTNF